MKEPIVIIGIGELATVFARGFLRSGYPVYPITRAMSLTQECEKIPSPKLVLLTVQENKLGSLLEQLPKPWRDRVGLVQNELIPREWQAHHIKNPTITVVWFEKKKELELTNILQSPSFGPNAEIISNALHAVDVPAPILEREQDILYELVRKAVYIFTVNIAGLVNNCTVGNLWLQHQSLAREIAEEVILIQESLTGQTFSHEKIINGMVEGIEDCPHRYCLGRSALSRLKRALIHAEQANLKTPKLKEIAENLNR